MPSVKMNLTTHRFWQSFDRRGRYILPCRCNAQIDLDWTVVVGAHFRTEQQRSAPVGNPCKYRMHRAVFTTIIQADPIYVDFAVPADEHRMLEILRFAGYMKIHRG